MRTLLSALTAVALLSTTACNDSPMAPGELIGVYQLETINEQPLPLTISQAPSYRLDLLFATFDLKADLTYALTSHYREIEGTATAEFDEVESGTWSTTPNTIVLRDAAGNATQARVQANSIIIDEGGLRLVFVR